MADETKTEEQKNAELLAAMKEPDFLEYKIEETGEVIKGKDMNEIVETLKKMHVDTRSALQETKKEKDALLAARVQPEPVKTNGEPAFNPDEYWKRINAGDILGAQNYVDSYRFGIPADEVVDTISTTVRQSQFAHDEIVTAKFKMENTDWPGTTEAANAVADRVRQMQAEASAQGDSVPRWSVRTLNNAWQDVKKDGRIKALDTSEQKVEKPGGPPPTLKGTSGGSIEDQIAERAATMPMSEFEELLRKQGKLA